MEMIPPKYRITDDNRLVYVLDTDLDGLSQEYTVWGICEKGFIHGAGAYLRRKNFGIPYTIIDKPTPAEFRRYYELRDRLEQAMRDKIDKDHEEELKKFLDDKTREEGDEWKDLLDDTET